MWDQISNRLDTEIMLQNLPLILNSNRLFPVSISCHTGLHVKASPDSPDSPDSPKHFLKKYDVFLIENGKISDFKLF